MEVFIRCEIPDIPGALATLAGALGEAGGDIQAVEVVERRNESVVDDLWVTTTDLVTMREHIEALGDAKVIHTAPSRGLPGDATTRLATGLDALLSGAMRTQDGLPTIIGGLLRADAADIVPHDEPLDRKKNRRLLRIDTSAGVLVLRREYRFLDSEIQRANQLLTVCERAAAIASS